jgi:hypothetical protein
MRILLSLVLLAGAFVALPVRAAACDASWPTFTEVLEQADEIIVGKVTDVRQVEGSRWPVATLSVERILRGDVGASLVVDRPAYLCGDGLSEADLGRRVLIATNVVHGPMTLSPYWWEWRGRLEGWADTPSGIDSLDELVRRIAAQLPDTATEDRPAQAAEDATRSLLVVGILAFVTVWLRPARRLGRAEPSILQ